MLLLKIHKNRANLTFSILRESYKRNARLSTVCKADDRKIPSVENLEKIAEKYNKALLYSSTLEESKLKFGYKRNKMLLAKFTKEKNKIMQELENEQPLPISLKYIEGLTNNDKVHDDPEKGAVCDTEADKQEALVNFPLESHIDVDQVTGENNNETAFNPDVAQLTNQEVRARNEMKNWMTSYDNYDDSAVEGAEEGLENWQINYGTPDPKSHVSNVPCGGCGALLHCKDTSIPGYIPSEIFKNSRQKGGSNLEAIICQRCHFLKHYNLALQVRVNPNDYPKVLQTVSERKGLVVLLVDLLDFPCSIWPGIADIFSKMPILVVGNKVDLLPQDSSKYLGHVKKTLLDSVKEFGFGGTNVVDVILTSATTGYGIEELVSKLYDCWRYRGDIYLVGCTNVGKSSLFNSLLQSDYCKIQAVDLIQRATTSPWPGTTLNLLKFPVTKPSAERLYLRFERLKKAKQLEKKERLLRKEQLRKTRNAKYATLMGHIGKTFYPHVDDIKEPQDAFSMSLSSGDKGQTKLGIDEKHPDFAQGRWCYDTPGVIQPDQIIHLLTAEELISTLPKELIRPRSFCLKPANTLFIAGLARLDYITGPNSIRLTVFCSKELPITVCSLDVADRFYEDSLGTELLKVPAGSEERLKSWPGLEKASNFKVVGIDTNYSCKDVVLSNAGWVAITGTANKEYTFEAWTPEKRGVYLRDCLLPSAVSLRGPRLRNSPAYQSKKIFMK